MNSDQPETLPPITTTIPPSWEDPETGQISARLCGDRYEQLGVLGEGGMGLVHRVLDRELNRIVAMKTLREPLRKAAAQQRFLTEAQVGAQLEHPGIIPVYDVGQRPDGLLYFTMREVHGETFGAVIARSLKTREAWSLHRLVDAFRRVCEAMAYAHQRGVIHRDIKPDNIMAGSFGQILVLDWGLARTLDSPDTTETVYLSDPSATRAGVVMGTHHFMPPEQRQGDTSRIGPASDVYALGAVLFQILFGEPPPLGEEREILSFAEHRKRVTSPWSEADLEGLLPIAQTALALSPEDRFASAGPLAEVMTEWLERRQRQLHGMQLVAQSDAEEEHIVARRQRAEGLREEAKAGRDTLSEAAIWALEDAADALDAEIVAATARRLQLLQGALTHEPELRAAHEALARYHHAEQVNAEKHGDHMTARHHELFLRHHDRGTFADWLSDAGFLTLTTDPPGATVRIDRFEEQGRKMVPVYRSTHTAPITRMSLPIGSYRLTLSAPGVLDTTYPVAIHRCEQHGRCRPGSTTPSPVRLLRPDELRPNESYIPAGWGLIGGDNEQGTFELQVVPAQVWLDSFIIQTHPVTVADFAAFLEALLASEGSEQATRLVPRWSTGNDAGRPFYQLTPGAVAPLPSTNGTPPIDSPIVNVTWEASRLYAAWLAEQTGLPWRLPTELEWERAARGVDGRRFPWGRTLSTRWCRMAASEPDNSFSSPIDSYPDDVSVYGVRSLGGNTSDWCLDPIPDVPKVSAGGLGLMPALDAPAVWRAVRGGSWSSSPASCRIARRKGMSVALTHPSIGIRLVRPL